MASKSSHSELTQLSSDEEELKLGGYMQYDLPYDSTSVRHVDYQYDDGLMAEIDVLLANFQLEDLPDRGVDEIDDYLREIDTVRVATERERERKSWEAKLATVEAERDQLLHDLKREKAKATHLQDRNASLEEALAELEEFRYCVLSDSIQRDLEVYELAYEHAEGQVYEEFSDEQAQERRATHANLTGLQSALEKEIEKNAQSETTMHAQIAEIAQLKEQLYLAEGLRVRQDTHATSSPPAATAFFAFKYVPEASLQQRHTDIFSSPFPDF